MTERYDQETILGYVEGELSDDQRAAFEGVLAEDHELRQLVSQMKLDRQALRSLGMSRAPVGLIDQVIQSHERSALLGDPVAPEPLPMTMPTSRWTFRRTLAYGSIAAVLILSFGLVFQTLIPPGLINHGTHVAQNSSDATDTSVPDVGDGVALLDEDSVYDKAGARALGRKLTKDSGESIKTPPADGALKSGLADGRVDTSGAYGVSEAAEADTPGPLVEGSRLGDKRDNEETLAGRHDDAVDALAASTPDTSEPSESPKSLVTAESSSDSPVALEKADTDDALAFADTALRDNVADESALSRQAKPEVMFAEAEAADESDADRFKGRVLGDAFAGYGTNLGDVPTQLVVNSSSPTQARRDIRDWALANSARVVESEPVASLANGSEGRRGGIGGAFNSLTGGPGRKTADASNANNERALLGSSRNETEARTKAVAADSYYVLIDQDQVPSLLSYLNRTQGQHAELIATESVAVSAGTGSAAADGRVTGATAGKPAEEVGEVEEKDEAPKAVANRLVDTESGWFQREPDDSTTERTRRSPIVRGLAGSPIDKTARRREVDQQPVEQEEKTEEAAADRASTETLDVKSRPANQPTYFDWSRLLEPRKESAPLVPTPSSDVASDAKNTEANSGSTPTPDPDTKLRIQIIIQQAADGVDVQESGDRE